jgi:hypothetical protein
VQERQVVAGGEGTGRDAGQRHARVVDQLGDHADLPRAGERDQVGGRLRVAGTLEHAARPGAQREDVPRSGQVGRGGRRVGQGADGRRAVGGGDPRADVDVIDRDGERRPVAVGVRLDHERQAERVGPLVAHGRAHDPAAVAQEERHPLGRDRLGRHDQVGLVLPVALVGHHDHPASRERGDRLVNRITHRVLQFYAAAANWPGSRPGPGEPR